MSDPAEGRLTDHGVPDTPTRAAEPLTQLPEPRRRTAAEEARTLVALQSTAVLCTLSHGDPWGSVVSYGALADGSPVLLVSTLAEHGRNLQRDPRASLVVAGALAPGEDPLDGARVTLAGRVHAPAAGPELDAAREAHLGSVPGASVWAGYRDFTFWVLGVERIRWVGGFGRMDSAAAEAYAAAEPDPVAGAAPGAVSHLNEDHADALLAMARALGGQPDATSARCLRADRYGLELETAGPRGPAWPRVDFAAPIDAPGGLRAATVELTRRARGG